MFPYRYGKSLIQRTFTSPRSVRTKQPVVTVLAGSYTGALIAIEYKTINKLSIIQMTSPTLSLAYLSNNNSQENKGISILKKLISTEFLLDFTGQ